MRTAGLKAIEAAKLDGRCDAAYEPQSRAVVPDDLQVHHRLPCRWTETAHQIVNAGDEELPYLAVGTKLSPEIAEYPNTGRFGILAELAPGADGNPRMLAFVGGEGESLNYSEGE